MLNKHKEHLIQLIQQRKEYIDTPIEDDDVLSYYALKAFKTTIILENYDGSRENNRTFLIYDGKKLYETTPLEDDILRVWDDEHCLLEDDDVEFIWTKPITEHGKL